MYYLKHAPKHTLDITCTLEGKSLTHYLARGSLTPYQDFGMSDTHKHNLSHWVCTCVHKWAFEPGRSTLSFRNTCRPHEPLAGPLRCAIGVWMQGEVVFVLPCPEGPRRQAFNHGFQQFQNDIIISGLAYADWFQAKTRQRKIMNIIGTSLNVLLSLRPLHIWLWLALLLPHHSFPPPLLSVTHSHRTVLP